MTVRFIGLMIAFWKKKAFAQIRIKALLQGKRDRKWSTSLSATGCLWNFYERLETYVTISL